MSHKGTVVIVGVYSFQDWARAFVYTTHTVRLMAGHSEVPTIYNIL